VNIETLYNPTRDVMAVAIVNKLIFVEVDPKFISALFSIYTE
jgi:hypothetical protein